MNYTIKRGSEELASDGIAQVRIDIVLIDDVIIGEIIYHWEDIKDTGDYELLYRSHLNSKMNFVLDTNDRFKEGISYGHVKSLSEEQMVKKIYVARG